MKRMLLAALLGVFALPGCIVAVESRTHRVIHDPPPSHDPEPEVVVEWTSARTVVLREYYECDWDTVGYFDYYERDCGIPEDDLFFLLHVSRSCGRPFSEVVFTYSNCNRSLFRVTQHYRFNHWDLYVDLPVGAACPPAYQRVYGYYWNRHHHPHVVYTNYDFHALFWLRFGTHYYGWAPRDCFTRWDHCVDNRVRFTTVIHREYQAPRRVVVHNWSRRPVRVIDPRERDVRVIETRRREVYKRVEVESEERSRRGEQVVRRLPAQERDRRVNEQKREWEQERNREVEIRRREPQKFEEYKRHDDNRRNDDRKDDRKDDRDDRKDDRRDPLKNDLKKDEPRRNEPKKNEPKKEEPRKDDGRKDDDRRDEKKAPPPEKKSPPKEEKKDERKGEERRDDRKDDREDRRDDRKKDDGRKDDGKKDDGKKNDGGKKDGGKKDKQSPPRQQPPQRQEPQRQQQQRQQRQEPQRQKEQPPQRQKEQPQKRERAPERKQEQKRQERPPQEKKQNDNRQDRRR